jgi:Carboxypeptidase regulatory-like domain
MRLSPFSARVTSLLIVLALVVGCAPSDGKLTGKVTVNGTPLKGGTVTLIPVGTGTSFSTIINQDGVYTFDQVKSGKYKVCVETASLKGRTGGAAAAYGGKSGGGAPKVKPKNVPPEGAKLPSDGYVMADPSGAAAAERAKLYVPIPPQYSDPDQTPLIVEVKGGLQAQQHDIPLT